jgi:hypothetical protein
MALLTEGQHAGEFIVSEANGSRSREKVTVLSGQNLKAGHVVGKVTKGSATAQADAANTGNGAMGAITVGQDSKPGAYKLTIVEPAANAGAFIVEDPDGVNIGRGTVGVAFNAGGLAFTLADGGTDFVAGDQFTITVAAGSGKVVEHDPAGTDGREVAAGILFDNVDASAADKSGVAIVRDAEVNDSELVYKTGMSAGDKTKARDDLKALGIITR